MDIEALAGGFATTLGIYLAIGVLFAVPFAWKGAAAIDPAAREGTWGFRVLLLPGATLLWPALMLRWFGGRTTPRVESNAHRRAAGGER